MSNMDIVKLSSTLPAIFNELRRGSKMLSVRQYTNNHQELSDFSIVFHISYFNAVQRSLDTLLLHKPEGEDEKIARLELIDSYQETLSGKGNSRSTIEGVYAPVVDGKNELIKGVKWHVNGDRLHLFGFLAQKRILVPGVYPIVNSSPITLAKKRLRALTPVNRFRQFVLANGRFGWVGIENMVLTEEDLYRPLEV